jgi:spermidine synthase
MEADPTAGDPAGPTRTRSGILLAVIFFSGFLSLVYQIVWSRLFYPVFGMNLAAITAVIAAFLGGLGLGAHLFGRVVDRAHPWKTVALLEAGIALFGVLIPNVTGPCAALFARLTPPGSSETLVHLVRFSGVTILLAGPCVLMGGTFPAFVRGYSRVSLRLGRDLGSLYALNTAGAAAGSLLAGVWLLPRFGMDGISYAAAAGNLAIALGAWLAGSTPARRDESRQASTDAKTSGDAKPSADAKASGDAKPSGSAAWTLYALLFLTGYIGLSFELLWTRALTQALGATYFSFSMILAAMLLGIVLGSALYRARLADREWPGLLAALTVLLFAASIVSFLLVGRLHALLVSLRALLALARDSPVFFVVPHLALSLVAFLPTAIVFGAIFPLCLRRLAAGGPRLGRDLGLAYAVNTAGSVAGVVLTGLVTIDRLGSGGTLWLLFVLLIAAIALAFLATTPRPGRWVMAGVLGTAALVTLFFPRDIFFENQLACLADLLPPDIKVLFRGEDATSMATLIEMPRAPFRYVGETGILEGTQRNIWHSNWLGVGGTRIYLWNVMGAYLAGMLHPDPGDVLVIGYGSGRQLRTLVSLPHLRHIDVVEISRLNLEASDYFYLDSREVLSDPRVTIEVGDGRNHLLRSRRLYDVIIVDVGGIGSDGSEFFYTREFLKLCRDHLAPRGLVFTWMDVRNVVEPLGAMYRRTMQDVFPNASIWLGTGEPTSYGWLWLVGGNEPLVLDAARLKQRWEALTPAQRAELALAGLREPLQMASLQLTSLGAAEPGPADAGPANPGDATARILTDVRPYSGPIWEIERPPGTSLGTIDAYAVALQQVLLAGEGPRLAGISEEERSALEERRREMRAMVLNGARKGPFRFHEAPPVKAFFS